MEMGWKLSRCIIGPEEVTVEQIISVSGGLHLRPGGGEAAEN